MSLPLIRLCLKLIEEKALCLPLRLADPKIRRFADTTPEKTERLKRVGETFIRGYNHALTSEPSQIGEILESNEKADQGFAFEGAAMAFTITDSIGFRGQRRLQSFLAQTGQKHCYMVHIGAGWALSKLPWIRTKVPERFEPLLTNLVFDGWGFSEAYLHTLSVINQQNPRNLPHPFAASYDQGVGRALWFLSGADPYRLSQLIEKFSDSQHSDLWSGAGLAAAYAGAATDDDLVALRNLAGSHRPALAQGAAFALEARHHAGNSAQHSELAFSLFSDSTSLKGLAAVAEGRRMANDNRVSLEPGEQYAAWRRNVQKLLFPKERLSA